MGSFQENVAHGTPRTSLGKRLQQERQRYNFSQEALAEALGTTARSIRRWEQDQAIPHFHYRKQLCRLFNISAEDLFGLLNR